MTRQIKDRLSFRRRKRGLEGYPLDAFLKQQGLRFDSTITSCWRGYTAVWTLSAGKLYLIKFSGSKKVELPELGRSYRSVHQSDLFPGQQKVFAEWYTGILCWHAGRPIYQDNFIDLYVHNYYVRIISGRVVATKVLNQAYLYFDEDCVAEKLFAGELDMSPAAMTTRKKHFKRLNQKGPRYFFDFD